jgi:diaminopimelate epimerase
MQFTKMHGLGNDYIYINCFNNIIANPAVLAPKISNRHFGVGGDGLVLILPSQTAAARMRMFNADGSEAEMCGNAIRCVAKFLYDRRLANGETFAIETAAGLKKVFVHAQNGVAQTIRVDMGEPILETKLVPVQVDALTAIDHPIEANNHVYHFTAVSMGNPHCVIFVPQITEEMVAHDGPQLERHPLFPQKTNVEFVTVATENELRMRVWERGSGETLACGTGACAAAVAAALNRLTSRKVRVNLMGGTLLIEWDEVTNHVWMTGPAVEVFHGEWLL